MICTRAECHRNIGQYVRFHTPYGYHEGIVEQISGDRAIILSPRHYIPVQFATETMDAGSQRNLDLALAWGAYGGARGGYPGAYGGGIGYGWGRWAVSFLIIYALWGLLW